MRISIEEIGGRGSRAYEVQELMATVLARSLRDGEMVGTGAGSALARAACRLAQLSHAPDLSFVAGGSGAINPLLEPLTASSCDYANLDCEAILPLADVIEMIASGRCDVFCYGGLQVDKFGNVNLSLIGDPDRPQLRGPGSAALPLVANVGRNLIFMTDHSPRSFVEKVAFVTAPGYLDGGESWRKAKAEGNYRGNGPALVVSNLGVFDFEEETKAMRLVSLHPNITLDQLKAATGFELIIPADIPVTPLPDKREQRILRELDSSRLLKG
ncbi:MAG TPA: CoA-transferase [Chloroflexia bacterium]|nr:CoA-transferase [Chloroflexia bacterium]